MQLSDNHKNIRRRSDGCVMTLHCGHNFFTPCDKNRKENIKIKMIKGKNKSFSWFYQSSEPAFFTVNMPTLYWRHRFCVVILKNVIKLWIIGQNLHVAMILVYKMQHRANACKRHQYSITTSGLNYMNGFTGGVNKSKYGINNYCKYGAYHANEASVFFSERSFFIIRLHLM